MALALPSAPSARSLAPKPLVAASAPAFLDVVEERQLAHVVGLDGAYFEGLTVMREAAGQDLSVPNLLADSYSFYLGYRHDLLRAKLEDQREHHAALGRYVPRNRFLMGAPSASEMMSPLFACSPVPGSATAQASATAPSSSSAAAAAAAPNAMALSYMSWRRALLANRFERRRAALEDEMCRRFAAEAMEAALAAESAESEATARTERAAVEATRREPQVWQPFNRFDSILGAEDELLLALQSLGTVSGGAGGGGAFPRQQRGGGGGVPAAVTSLFADGVGAAVASGAVPGAAGDACPSHRITALAFAARDADCFAVATESGSVFLCSAAAGVRWATLSGHTDAVISMDWNTRGRDTLLLTVSADHTVRVWKVTMPTIVYPPPPQQQQQFGYGGGDGGPPSLPSSAGSTGEGGFRPTSLSQQPHPQPQQPPLYRGNMPLYRGNMSSGGSGFGRPPSTPVRNGGGGASAGARSRSVDTPSHRHLTPPRTAKRSALRSGASPPGGGPPVTPAKGGYLEPGERAAELGRARVRMLAEAEEERVRREAAVGPQVRGGGAYCLRTIPFDAALTHAAWMPVHPGIFVAATVEEADLDLEAEAAAAETRGEGGWGEPALEGAEARGEGDAGAAAASRGGVMGDFLKKGLAGGMGVVRGVGNGMKAVGNKTMQAIEAVPVVGGAAKMTGALAKAVVTGEFVAPQPTRRRERRGALLVVNALNGRVLQSRLVRGAIGPKLTKPHSFVTALAFSTSGHQLFVADARGLLHEYTIETDPADAQIKPLRDHEIIFGEGGNVFAHTAAGASGAGVLVPGGGAPGGMFAEWAAQQGGGFHGFGGFGADAGGGGGGGGHTSLPPVFLTSLFYRPYDSALRSPLLIGLDSAHRVRALTVPAPTTATEQHWRHGQQGQGAPGSSAASASAGGRGPGGAAPGNSQRGKESAAAFASAAKTGARLAVGAFNTMTNATVTAVTLGAVSGEKLAVNLNLVPQAQELRDFVAYAGGGAGASLSHFPGLPAPSSAAAAGGHSALVPCRLNDGLVAGSPYGDIFIVNPHASGVAPGPAGTASAVFAGLAVGGRDAAVGSGVVPAQVVSRLSGAHPPFVPVSFLCMNREETVLISADDRGGLAAWHRVPLSSVEAEEEAAWGTSQRPSMSTLGLASPGAPPGGRTSSRIAALFDTHMSLHSVGRAAAEEARRLALGHLGGAASQRPPTMPLDGHASVGRHSHSQSARAGSDSLRRGLPTGWTQPPSGSGGQGVSAAVAGALANVVGAVGGGASGPYGGHQQLA